MTETASSSPASFTRLFRAELDRHLRRRVTWIGAALLFGGSILVSGETWLGVGEHLMLVGVLGAVWGYLNAASWIGHDISSGSLGTWLTFHPRRGRVWLARLLVVSLTALAVGAVTMLAHVPMGLAYESTLDPHEAWTALVALTIIWCGTLMGAGVAAALGSTLASLGAAGAYLALVFVTSVMFGHEAPWGPLWSISELLVANGYSCVVADSSYDGCPGAWYAVQAAHLAALWAWTAVVVGVGTWRWSRRDVD